MALIQPISFTPPPVGVRGGGQAGSPFSSSPHPESPSRALGSRSPPSPPWAWPPLPASEPLALPATRAVSYQVSEPLALPAMRSVSPQVMRVLSPAASIAPVVAKYPPPSLGVTEAAPYLGLAVNSPPRLSGSLQVTGPQISSPPMPSSPVQAAGPQLNSYGAFKFYGPHDLIDEPALQPPINLGSFGLGASGYAPLEQRRERLVTEDTTASAFDTSGMPSRILDYTVSSLGSNEYGPSPSSLQVAGQVARQETVLQEEVLAQAPLPPPRLELEEMQMTRGQAQMDFTELEALRQMPPPPDAGLLPAWQSVSSPETGQALRQMPPPPDAGLPPAWQSVSSPEAGQAAGLPGISPPPPVSPGSYQQPSPGSFQPVGLSTGYQSPGLPSGYSPASPSGYSLNSPRGFQAQEPLRPPTPRESPEMAAQHQHIRLRNLGYHDNMDALNNVHSHVSTRARTLQSQLRAKSPGAKRSLRHCC